MLPGRAALQGVRDGIRTPPELPSGSKTFTFDLESASQPRVGLRRMDQRIEEYLSVTIRQNERLMLGDGPPGRLGKGRQTEISQAAAFELGRPRHHLLGLTIHADAEARFARAVFLAGGRRPGAAHIRSPYRKNDLGQMYVQWDHKSRIPRMGVGWGLKRREG